MTRLRIGKSVHRYEVVDPSFVRLFTPFCFGSCRIPQQFGGLQFIIGVSLERTILVVLYSIYSFSVAPSPCDHDHDGFFRYRRAVRFFMLSETLHVFCLRYINQNKLLNYAVPSN